MNILGVDHMVLTVSDVPATLRFYTEVLGLRAVSEGGRHALHFGAQKINLHARPGQFQPAAAHPAPGTADFCLVAQGPMTAVLEHIRPLAAIELGPVPRQGARGSMQSIYLRDPDGNLVEICVYDA